MAIDIIARGLATSLTGSDGKISSDKMPTFNEIGNTSGFTPIGGVTDPSMIVGKTAEEVMLMMLFGIVNPTFTNPDLAIELSTPTTVTVGGAAQVTGALTYNRGSITPAYGTSGFRAGAPLSYTIGGNTIASSATTQNFSIEFTPTVGANEISYSVSFSEGEQPLNSIGQPFGAPYPAGSITKTFTITGVYALYNGQQEVQEFEYFQEEDGQGYQTISASETDGIKQSFAVAEDVTVIGIKQFDIMTQQWLWIGGSAEASLETFDTTIIEGDTLGENTNYVLYTHNGSARGERELRIYVTYN